MSALADRLRGCLAAPAAEPPLEGDYPELRIKASKQAAVLMAITDRPHPGLLLTVRREHLRTHAGQIAFPGGGVEQGEDAVGAALREAQEEILLDPAVVEVVRSIEPYRTVTGYVITPVLGVVPADLPLMRTKWRSCSKRLSPSCSTRQTSIAEARCSRNASATITRSCGKAGGSGGQPRQ